ncbi:TonB-dependent siderophore receptor [Pleurocapsa sp. CCALA 161]|uniref:TonB-dependent siderophore receptor n=1 Tax=Pleurocapsa sp. CCALA 161 TaxID=2107688 RepID=UPI000D055F8E|nr:TonB-dependent siderophore receptor [Pleurocapsa sp. CCALA 161]PSB09567.1 TonB-dependent siderophore receptor [Pleurocapsa sp. CCALA 161]
MKQKFNNFGLFLGYLSIFLCLYGIKPVAAKTKNPETKSYSISAQNLLAQETSPEKLIRVTGVELKETAKGLELVFQTPTGQKLVPLILPEGNNLIIDILDATLALPTGNNFRETNPAPGITEIKVVQIDDSNIQIVITGEKNAPSVELVPSRDDLILSVSSQASTAQTEVDEEIEVIATGEGEAEDDYVVPKVTSATRSDTSILDTPESVQVIPQKVLEDQQIIRLDEALRNVSGVTFGGTDLGRNLQFSIRGFDQAPIIRNGFRQFGADVIPETANLERIEVLKGPASLLFGEIEPGGLINLVTKKPTSEPFYNIETQFGNRSFISPSIDFSGPLTKDGNLLYRLNALYRSSDGIQDVDENIERFYISPVVTWKVGKNTDLNFELEYANDDRPPSYGVPAIGEEIADIPFDQITNEPDDFGSEEFLSVGYDLEHRFSKNWKLRNAFRFTQQTARLETAFPFEIDEESNTVFRFWAAQPQDGESYSLQTSTEGKFATGKIDHQVLLGLDLNLTEDNLNDLIRLDEETPLELDLFNPVYDTSPRPDFDTLPLISDRETETRRLGIFAQDRVTFGKKFFLLAGLRYDTVEQIVTDNLEQTELSNTNDSVVPRVGVVYKPIKPVSLYASYSQSFAPNPETTSDGEALDPTEGEGFEFGVKSEFLKGKLFTTLAYFNIDKENVASEDPDDPFSSVATGKQSSQGIELDVTGEIMSGWNIIASYAYIDAEVSEDNAIAVGNRLPNAPENSAGLWTTYQLQQGNLQGLGFGLGFNFVGEREGDLDNSFQLDSFFLTNGAIFYERNNWRAALNLKNIFDVDYIVGASPVRERGNDPGEPFTVVGSLAIEF